MVFSGLLGGMVAGFVSSPLDCVFARMQVDAVYPEGYKRNYTSFIDGFTKTAQEGALFRGALANALKLGMLCCCMTGPFDLAKENSYFWLGPSTINRFWATAVVTILGIAVSQPFDQVRVRLQTMRPLPNGQYPYGGTLDCLNKMCKYECNTMKSANLASLYAGAFPAWVRLFAICWVSQYLLDYYHKGNFVQEFWQPPRYNYHGGIDFDIHEPFTLAFHKGMVSYTKPELSVSGANHPDRQSGVKLA